MRSFAIWTTAVLTLVNGSLAVLSFTHMDELRERLKLQPPALEESTDSVPNSVRVDQSLSPERQAIITQTLATLDLPWPSLGTIKIVSRAANQLSCAHTDTATSTIYLGPDCPDLPLAYLLTHELGHVVDAQLLTTQDRQAYCQLRGIAQCEQWSLSTYAASPNGATANWDSSPAEDFAEEFVRWQLGAQYPNHTTFGSGSGLEEFWSTL